MAKAKVIHSKDTYMTNGAEIRFFLIKKFTTCEGNFSVWDTEKSYRRPDMFTVWEKSDGWVIRNALVPESSRRQGLATEFYTFINKLSLDSTGEPLRSTQPRKLLQGMEVFELSDAGRYLWDSLVKKGLAQATGQTYKFICPPPA